MPSGPVCDAASPGRHARRKERVQGRGPGSTHHGDRTRAPFVTRTRFLSRHAVSRVASTGSLFSPARPDRAKTRSLHQARNGRDPLGDGAHGATDEERHVYARRLSGRVLARPAGRGQDPRLLAKNDSPHFNPSPLIPPPKPPKLPPKPPCPLPQYSPRLRRP